MEKSPREVRIFGHQETGGRTLQPTIIVIADPIPDGVKYEGDMAFSEFLEKSAERFNDQAQPLFEALRDTLPGGTIDRLTGLLLQYKASHFTVTYQSAPISPADQVTDDAIAAQGNAHLTDAQRRLVALDVRKAEITGYYEELESTLQAIAEESGINSYFKTDDGIVYKIMIPEGKFVSFKPFDYVRTKRDGERAGTLSQKEAATVFPAAKAE